MAQPTATPPGLPLDHARAIMLCHPTTPPDSPIVSLNNQLANEWLAWLRDQAERTPQTIYNYASLVAHYLDTCVGARPLDAVQSAEIEQWLLRPRQGRARGQVAAPATRARNIAVLRSFYKWMLARGLVQVNVPAQLATPKVRNRQPRAIGDGDWRPVWATAQDDPIRGILLFGFYLGLRRAELTALRPDHVDHERRMLRGFVRKGGGDDTIAVGPILNVWEAKMPHLLGGHTADTLWQQIEHYATHPTDGTLLGLRNPDHANKALGAHLTAIGRPALFTPHALRHSFVTNLLRCGLPIQLVSELANHSSLDVTMRYAKQGADRVTEWLQESLASPTVTVSDWTP